MLQSLVTLTPSVISLLDKHYIACLTAPCTVTIEQIDSFLLEILKRRCNCPEDRLASLFLLRRQLLDLVLDEHKKDDAVVAHAFEKACFHGCLEVVQRVVWQNTSLLGRRMLVDGTIEPLPGSTSASGKIPRTGITLAARGMANAARQGYLDIVRVLAEDADLPLNFWGSLDDPLVAACCFGHEEVVRYLLTDPRYDPSDHDNVCIQTAVKSGSQIVAALLEDPRVDPTVGNFHALIEAKCRGATDILLMFLKDRRVKTDEAWRVLSNDPVILQRNLTFSVEERALLLGGQATDHPHSTIHSPDRPSNIHRKRLEEILFGSSPSTP
jgi:hypothetical protein